ncbi:hypothetical protein CBR_g18940 [Chara braunii]|uniref:Uncharacterized protein n=1 Tax=Chara braunii TaxID=69332 RepID=A0A388KWS9_CHABU|nr:hypothetical protein CBR_g18940 [Chara braunii]|eukprot:GBG74530.1 hypothetical protein CBR_g18940 [Chara braunii]
MTLAGVNTAVLSIKLGFRDFAHELVGVVGAEVGHRLDKTERFCAGAIEGVKAASPKEEEARPPRREPVKVKFPDSYSGKREENFDNWEANVKTYVHLQQVFPDQQVLIAIHALRDEAACFARSLVRAANCSDDPVAYSSFTSLTEFLKLLRERFADVARSVKASDKLQTIHARKWKSVRALKGTMDELVAVPDHGITEAQLVNLFYRAMPEAFRGQFFAKSEDPATTYDSLSRELVAFEAKSVSLSTFWHKDLDRGKQWKGRTISGQVKTKDSLVLTLDEGGVDEIPYEQIEWGLEEEDSGQEDDLVELCTRDDLAMKEKVLVDLWHADSNFHANYYKLTRVLNNPQMFSPARVDIAKTIRLFEFQLGQVEQDLLEVIQFRLGQVEQVVIHFRLGQVEQVVERPLVEVEQELLEMIQFRLGQVEQELLEVIYWGKGTSGGVTPGPSGTRATRGDPVPIGASGIRAARGDLVPIGASGTRAARGDPVLIGASGRSGNPVPIGASGTRAARGDPVAIGASGTRAARGDPVPIGASGTSGDPFPIGASGKKSTGETVKGAYKRPIASLFRSMSGSPAGNAKEESRRKETEDGWGQHQKRNSAASNEPLTVLRPPQFKSARRTVNAPASAEENDVGRGKTSDNVMVHASSTPPPPPLQPAAAAVAAGDDKGRGSSKSASAGAAQATTPASHTRGGSSKSASAGAAQATTRARDTSVRTNVKCVDHEGISKNGSDGDFGSSGCTVAIATLAGKGLPSSTGISTVKGAYKRPIASLLGSMPGSPAGNAKEESRRKENEDGWGQHQKRNGAASNEPLTVLRPPQFKSARRTVSAPASVEEGGVGGGKTSDNVMVRASSTPPPPLPPAAADVAVGDDTGRGSSKSASAGAAQATTRARDTSVRTNVKRDGDEGISKNGSDRDFGGSGCTVAIAMLSGKGLPSSTGISTVKVAYKRPIASLLGSMPGSPAGNAKEEPRRKEIEDGWRQHQKRNGAASNEPLTVLRPPQFKSARRTVSAPASAEEGRGSSKSASAGAAQATTRARDTSVRTDIKCVDDEGITKNGSDGDFGGSGCTVAIATLAGKGLPLYTGRGSSKNASTAAQATTRARDTSVRTNVKCVDDEGISKYGSDEDFGGSGCTVAIATLAGKGLPSSTGRGSSKSASAGAAQATTRARDTSVRTNIKCVDDEGISKNGSDGDFGGSGCPVAIATLAGKGLPLNTGSQRRKPFHTPVLTGRVSSSEGETAATGSGMTSAGSGRPQRGSSKSAYAGAAQATTRARDTSVRTNVKCVDDEGISKNGSDGDFGGSGCNVAIATLAGKGLQTSSGFQRRKPFHTPVLTGRVSSSEGETAATELGVMSAGSGRPQYISTVKGAYKRPIASLLGSMPGSPAENSKEELRRKETEDGWGQHQKRNGAASNEPLTVLGPPQVMSRRTVNAPASAEEGGVGGGKNSDNVMVRASSTPPPPLPPAAAVVAVGDDTGNGSSKSASAGAAQATTRARDTSVRTNVKCVDDEGISKNGSDGDFGGSECIVAIATFAGKGLPSSIGSRRRKPFHTPVLTGRVSSSEGHTSATGSGMTSVGSGRAQCSDRLSSSRLEEQSEPANAEEGGVGGGITSDNVMVRASSTPPPPPLPPASAAVAAGDVSGRGSSKSASAGAAQATTRARDTSVRTNVKCVDDEGISKNGSNEDFGGSGCTMAIATLVGKGLPSCTGAAQATTCARDTSVRTNVKCVDDEGISKNGSDENFGGSGCTVAIATLAGKGLPSCTGSQRRKPFHTPVLTGRVSSSEGETAVTGSGMTSAGSGRPQVYHGVPEVGEAKYYKGNYWEIVWNSRVRNPGFMGNLLYVEVNYVFSVRTVTK